MKDFVTASLSCPASHPFSFFPLNLSHLIGSLSRIFSKLWKRIWVGCNPWCFLISLSCQRPSWNEGYLLSHCRHLPTSSRGGGENYTRAMKTWGRYLLSLCSIPWLDCTMFQLHFLLFMDIWIVLALINIAAMNILAHGRILVEINAHFCRDTQEKGHWVKGPRYA